MGKKFQLFPDFPTGGLVDVSDYRDGNGKVLVRAKLDVSDTKRIVIRELPLGSTTESLIASVETAAKAGRIKIQSISDFTAEQVEIEVKLARGIYSQETVDALFAFTECEQSISVNLLVIKDGLPTIMTVTELIQHHANQLVSILTRELELEKGELLDKLHQRTLERIFIEERIYKSIEDKKTAETVIAAVITGFKPFLKEIGKRGVTQEDVERLLKIPIRRISLYDINKAKAEMKEIQERIGKIEGYLKNIIAYATDFLDSLIQKVKSNEELGWGKRKAKVGSFEKVDMKEVVKRDQELRYDSATGYLGTAVSGGRVVAEVSSFDRILVVRYNGTYSVVDVPDKVFVDKNAWWIGIADKEVLGKTVFTILYKEKESGFPYIKRCIIEGWILGKEYSLIPREDQALHVDIRDKFSLVAYYTPKPRLKITKETFKAQDYLVKGLKAGGVRLASKEIDRIEVK
jgi:topoisomerase-4 subunit A